MNDTAHDTTAVMILLVEYEPWAHSSEWIKKEMQHEAQILVDS